MGFSITLYLSLAVFFLGLLWRILGWLRARIGVENQSISPATGLIVTLKACLRTLLSRRFLAVAAALITDILLQIPLLKVGFFRWLAHMCMFYGFLLLVLMHALDETITAAIFPDYAATLNPFLFLRNLFGALVIFGIAIAIISRIYRGRKFQATCAGDRVAIAILAIVLFSGFLLESVKIFSEPVFDRMVADYMGTEDDESIASLKAYWSRDFHVVFSDPPGSDDIETGRNLHVENCAACHSRPEAAFLSLGLSRILQPLSLWLNQASADIWLWYIHFGASFIALALLPFTKFFHLITVPLSLMVRAGTPSALPSSEQTSMARLALGMDACTHCGVCSEHCSVAPIHRVIPNHNILPSEKMAGVKKLAHGRQQDDLALEALSEGSFICTECYRCTQLCPSGISLQSLWQASKQTLSEKEFPAPHGWVRQLTADQWADRLAQVGTDMPFSAVFARHRHVSESPETFSACIQCSICTNICPVVSTGDGLAPPEVTPQQVMNLLRLNLKDLALGSRMVWDCVTCYLCQEHCPQGIRVTDILYDLRNIASLRLQTVRQLPLETQKDSNQADHPHMNPRKKVL